LFNSYYNAAGDRLPRAHRGFLSRPTVADILDYRAHVNEHMARYIAQEEGRFSPEAELVFETGLQHEQQHQELLLMDVKFNFFMNPLYPAYAAPLDLPQKASLEPAKWIDYPGTLTTQGHDGK